MSRSDDMAALREQVQAGHSDREEFVSKLTQSGIDLSKANQAQNKARRRSLMEVLAANEKSRRQDAARLHKTCVKYVTGLAQTIAAQRKANAAENAAARSAWLGAAIA
ncbi:MAG: hypothetical protein Q7S69_08795 [Nitrosomonadaceae bacterium]|nr:hypothetical protein [Nitrosomonadaceae bacterium]